MFVSFLYHYPFAMYCCAVFGPIPPSPSPHLDLQPSEMENNNHWQTIRPWTNRISLRVKELTSISATFLLTSVSPGLDTTLSNDEPQPSHANSAQASAPVDLRRSLRDVLRRGLTVKVNGVPWPKVVPHIEDDDSEAIIILYGFLPARTYDIELSIAPDEEPLRKQIATRQGIMIASPLYQAIYSFCLADPPSDESEEEPSSPVLSASTQSHEGSPSPEPSPPITPDSPSIPRPISVEERAAQLRLTHTSLVQEMESLNAQLKLARRESQRSDAVLRAEIEAIKRTAEKQSVADQRAKQKVLALQEAVKQTNAATGDLEAEARAVEGDLPRVRQEEAVVEVEYATVREIADKKEAETEEALRADKKRISEAQTELSSVTNRLEKLQAKRGKLESETLPELEQQLAEIQQQIEEAIETSRWDPIPAPLISDPLSVVGSTLRSSAEPYYPPRLLQLSTATPSGQRQPPSGVSFPPRLPYPAPGSGATPTLGPARGGQAFDPFDLATASRATHTQNTHEPSAQVPRAIPRRSLSATEGPPVT